MPLVDEDADAAAASSQGCWYERPAKRLDRTVECGRLRLQLRERPGGTVGTGGDLWPASRALLHYLSDAGLFPGEAPLAGMRVVELGAGTGLPGLACAALGAEVTLTDEGRALGVVRENIDANGGEDGGSKGRCCAAVLSWGQDVSHLQPPFDLVLGADILYLPESYPDLVRTVDALMGADGRCILAWERRSPLEASFLDLAGATFQVSDAFQDLDRSARAEFANISLVTLRKAPHSS